MSTIKKRRLTQIPNKPHCQCELCAASHRLIHRPSTPYLRVSSKKYFTWILKALGAASQTHSVFLNFPETAVFDNGRPVFVLSTSRDRQLSLINSPEKLKPSEIIKTFTNIVRTRKKEVVLNSRVLLARLLFKHVPEVFSEQSKEAALVRYASDTNEEKGPFRIMNEKEFTELLWESPGSKAWRKILYLQTLLKAKGGIGEPCVYKFKSKPEYKLQERVHLLVSDDYSSLLMEKELQSACKTTDRVYEVISLRIAYYVAIVTGWEIVNMDVELLQDIHGKIWVVYISNIEVVQFEKSDNTSPSNELITRKDNLDEYVVESSPRVQKFMKKVEDSLRTFGIEPIHIIEKFEKSEECTNERIATPIRRRVIPRTSVPPLRPMAQKSEKQLDWRYHPRCRIRPTSRHSNSRRRNSFFSNRLQ